MKRIKMLLPGALTFLSFILCHNMIEAAAQKETEAKLEKIEGSDLSTITLTQKAAERLDIKTIKVRQEPEDKEELEKEDVEERKKSGGNVRQKVIIPYSAILYDPKGETWVYTSPKPLSFVRYPIVIDDIEDDYVALSKGPPIGTEVVTVGVAELYGVEKGIGK